MVRQYDAQVICDTELKKYNLWEEGWRTNFNKMTQYIALCHYDTKRIIISIPHLNARSEAELMDTIRHEIAHALVGYGNGHNDIWRNKAIEIGLSDPVPCSISNLDKGRAIAAAETVKTRPIKALTITCPICSEPFEVASQANFSGTLWMVGKCGHLIDKTQIKDTSESISGWTNISGSKTLFPYQADGIRFIGAANGRALVADEPGLGKTIIALGALKFYPEMRPALWVCKPTLKIQALKEAIEWDGAEMMGQIIEHGKMYIIPGLNLYIISMDLLRNMPTEKLEEIPFKTIIADEIQHFKNPDSTRTNELRKLVARAEYFIPLSGTPWKNRGSEYYPVLNMLHPEMFPSPKQFKNEWVEFYLDTKTGKYKEGGILNIPRFRKFTESFVIRRMRDDVLPDLPKINRQIRFVDMDALYKKSYEKNEAHVANIIKAAMIDGTPMKQIASMIMQLKHITGIAKVRATVDDVEEWIDNTEEEFEKLTIFHHHIDVGDYLQKGIPDQYDGIDKMLVDRGYNPSLRLFGGRSAEERDYVIESFKKDPKNRILVASTLASGEGLNIQFCQNVMQIERQWNPQNEEQAEMRFSRPLTKSDLPEYLHPIADRKISIRVPYFIAVGTVDEILTEIVERKRHNFRKSMNVKDEFIQWSENDIIQEVADAIIKRRFGKV